MDYRLNIADNLTSAPSATQLHLTLPHPHLPSRRPACTRNSINRNLLANLDGGNAGKFGSVESTAPERVLEFHFHKERYFIRLYTG